MDAVADARYLYDSNWSHAVAIGKDHILREPKAAYMHDFASKIDTLSSDNGYLFRC